MAYDVLYNEVRPNNVVLYNNHWVTLVTVGNGTSLNG